MRGLEAGSLEPPFFQTGCDPEKCSLNTPFPCSASETHDSANFSLLYDSTVQTEEVGSSGYPFVTGHRSPPMPMPTQKCFDSPIRRRPYVILVVHLLGLELLNLDYLSLSMEPV